MLASFRWLQELCPVDADVVEVARRLSLAGLEVEAMEHKGEDLAGVVVAEVRAKKPHPSRDKLTVVRAFDGENEHDVVCGAPNVPGPGGRVLFARSGSTLPGGMQIEARKVGGVQSHGMICSETELGIGGDAEGIFVMDADHGALPGTPVADALDLHDVILDISLTPNRPDCLGHVGIAREMGVLFGLAYRPRPTAGPSRVFSAARSFKEGQPTTDLAPFWDSEGDNAAAPKTPRVAVEIVDGDRCPRYGAALVSGVTVGPSPFWLRYRLHNLGLRALSNVVDATNLILLEWGHPIHGFDVDRLRGANVIVRLAREGETMATLDGVERRFTSDDLLICDAEGPVAVAGVMGGLDSEIRDETKHVLIECAYFDPRSIRRTSRRLGLHTDSSHRFERGVDPQAIPRVLASAASLIGELGRGDVGSPALDRIAKPHQPVSIGFRPERATRLLGTPVSKEAGIEALRALGFEVTDKRGKPIEAKAPSWRPDVKREVDLIEEVARVRGYDQIPTAMPRAHVSELGTPALLRLTDELRDQAVAAGLYEAINYGFVAREELRRARVPTDAVALANPLSEERAVMRTSLLPGLAAAATRAQRRGANEVRLFEVARIFHPSREDILPSERTMMGIVLSGLRTGWIGDDRPFDLYDGKGVVEAIVDQVFGRKPALVSGTLPELMHPKRTGLLTLASRPVGFVGEIHPDVAEALEMIGRVVYAELDVAALGAISEELGPPQARELPKFPAVTRDIAMLVRDEFSAGEIANALGEASGGLAESVRLFDLYRGDQVPAGHRSLAFRVTYRDIAGTLTDKQVDKVHAVLAEVARDRFEATIR